MTHQEHLNLLIDKYKRPEMYTTHSNSFLNSHVLAHFSQILPIIEYPCQYFLTIHSHIDTIKYPLFHLLFHVLETHIMLIVTFYIVPICYKIIQTLSLIEMCEGQ